MEVGRWKFLVCAAASGELKYGRGSWDIGEMTASIMCRGATGGDLVVFCMGQGPRREKGNTVVGLVIGYSGDGGLVWRIVALQEERM